MSKMYDELVKRLRSHNGWALTNTLNDAADAIEEMQGAERKFLYNISVLESQIDQLKREREWIPVTERLPDQANLVLIRHHSNTGNHFYGLDVYDGVNWVISENVTHWMPLPEPPIIDTEG